MYIEARRFSSQWMEEKESYSWGRFFVGPREHDVLVKRMFQEYDPKIQMVEIFFQPPENVLFIQTDIDAVIHRRFYRTLNEAVQWLESRTFYDYENQINDEEAVYLGYLVDFTIHPHYPYKMWAVFQTSKGTVDIFRGQFITMLEI